MRRSLLEILVDPVERTPLSLTVKATGPNDTVLEGTLTSATGATYEITDGIPCFVPADEQQKTATSFGYKWKRQETYEFDHYVDLIRNDEVPRWGFDNVEHFYDMFRNRKRILDAGCGSAHFASIYVPHAVTNGEWVGTDLSTAIHIAQQRLGQRLGTNFVRANLLELPYKDASFDMVFCRGVMHHTPSTYRAFKSLSRVVEPGGEFAFLIYRKMGPIREFTDAYIRDEVISKLTPDEGWDALAPLTKFGKALADLKVEVDVPEDIPYLGIPKGKHDIHRLVYYYFLKAYWNPDLSFDTNQHNTFDWYHPPYSSHHTAEEIQAWAKEAGFRVTFMKEMETSWAVRTVRL